MEMSREEDKNAFASVLYIKLAIYWYLVHELAEKEEQVIIELQLQFAMLKSLH